MRRAKREKASCHLEVSDLPPHMSSEGDRVRGETTQEIVEGTDDISVGRALGGEGAPGTDTSRGDMLSGSALRGTKSSGLEETFLVGVPSEVSTVGKSLAACHCWSVAGGNDDDMLT